MDTLFIPNEGDFRRWIKDAVREVLENAPTKEAPLSPDEEPLLTRKEIAGMFRISLVTLHDWMKRGLPCHKQRGRVYFLRSEVLAYLKQKGHKPIVEPDYPAYLPVSANPITSKK
jgi:predicted DNA-binding transcriptional regulator AlpA